MAVNTIKNAPLVTEQQTNLNSLFTISGKTWTVKELAPFFTRSALRFATKEQLLELWQIAVESGVKQFRDAVDNEYLSQYPHE